MRKLDFCTCENKDADQLCGNSEADQRLCFRYTDSTIPLLPKYDKPLAILCGCTARFVLDLVGNPEDRFSHNEAHLIVLLHKTFPSDVLLNCSSTDQVPIYLKNCISLLTNDIKHNSKRKHALHYPALRNSAIPPWDHNVL